MCIRDRLKTIKNRRKFADRFLAFFPTPWSSGLKHLCRDGCCGDPGEGAAANRPKSVQRAQELIRELLGRILTEPAANKWTSLTPVTKRVALLASVGNNLFRRAVGMRLGKSDTGSADGSFAVDIDGAIGVPQDMGILVVRCSVFDVR